MKKLIKKIRIWRVRRQIRKTWRDLCDICPNEYYRNNLLDGYVKELEELLES